MYRVGEVIAGSFQQQQQQQQQQQLPPSIATSTMSILQEEPDLWYGKIVSASDKSETGLRRLKIEVMENCYQNYLSSEVLKIFTHKYYF